MTTITQQDLNHFYGTMQYYRHWTGFLNLTDGVQYLNTNGAGWLIDAIASYQGEKALRTQELREFQLWNLKLDGKGGAVLTCQADSNTPNLVEQKIEYTDFPFDIKLYVENGVLLLTTEH